MRLLVQRRCKRVGFSSRFSRLIFTLHVCTCEPAAIRPSLDFIYPLVLKKNPLRRSSFLSLLPFVLPLPSQPLWDRVPCPTGSARTKCCFPIRRCMPILGFVPVLHHLCLSFVLSWEYHLHQHRAWRFEFGELRLAGLLLGILRYGFADSARVLATILPARLNCCLVLA